MAHDEPHREYDVPRPEEPATGEAFDAANQSLVDALRLSFRILKVVMICTAVIYLFSGLFIVERDKKVAVHLRFGEQKGTYREGVHLAWPYPIDEVIQVPIAQESVSLDAFWIQISEQDKARKTPLSDLMPRGEGLEPGVDGALLTGDRGIMHLQLQAQYRITDADQYIRNVIFQGEDRTAEKDLLKAVLKNACVASAARATAETIWKYSSEVGDDVRVRAQAALDRMETGITLDKVDVAQSYYPLQVKGAVDNVTNAMNAKEQAIQAAYAQRQKTLNEAAGKVWEDLWKKIQELDQAPAGPDRDRILADIDELLTEKAAGKAGRRIQEARQQREQIVLATLARRNEFLALLEQHRLNPELLRQRLLTAALSDLFSKPGVTKWILPPGDNKQIDLWLNPDPKEFKERQEAEMRRQTGAGPGK